MPEIDGIELMLRLRQSKIPIISISGLSRESIVTELFVSLGIIGFLQKPFKPSEIVALIESAAPNSQKYDNDKQQNPLKMPS
jgi:CheY-like chemotaxis protein